MAKGLTLRIAVIDDSVVVRRLVADTLSKDPNVGEVRTAGDGKEGVELVRSMRPDLVTMDIEMPVMDGIAAVREIRRFDRSVPIIMFSTLTEAAARATFEAMAAGATDFVTKPGQAASISASLQTVRSELMEKVLALTGQVAPRAAVHLPGMARSAAPRPGGAPGAAAPGVAPRPRPGEDRFATPRVDAAGRARPGRDASAPVAGSGGSLRVVAIGSSTGGPEALGNVVGRLPSTLPVPIVVTQHMPPMFTRLLAERLNATSALRVSEAVDGAVLEPGSVMLAPGGRHLVVVRDGVRLRAGLRDTPPVNSCRPAVDVLFTSLAQAVGPAALGIVLTGMGSDGAAGAAAMVQAGARIWVQDEATSVVWGMPGATVATTTVERQLPIGSIADAISRSLTAPPAGATVGGFTS